MIDMADKIHSAYDSSKNIYDDILTQNSLWGKLYMNLFWGGTDDNIIAEKVLGHIPEDFSGSLLDVPVGTAVFTEKKWRSLSCAQITCLDYSEDMLQQAEKRLDGVDQVTCVQGDVGQLQFPDASFDIVLSMNGFHAFPDKNKAYEELHRVLKPGGTFLSCFYVEGNSKVTDWLVRQILAKKGWFTAPFQTEAGVKSSLDALFRDVECSVDGSMIYFKCTK